MGYSLGKNILATVTYYDVLDFPLTAFEVWKHLVAYDDAHGKLTEPVSLREVRDFLAYGSLTAKVFERDGFYFLAGRGHLVRERIQSEKLSAAKLKRMKRLARLIACVPYVRMLGATGSLSMKHGSLGSDWDMFVVLRSGKMWIGRTLLTVFLQLIGKRRHGRSVNNRACLNYFVTDDNLEIATKDLFSANEYRFLIPLISLSLFQKFEARNIWIRRYKPQFFLTTVPSLWLVQESVWALWVQTRLEYIFDLFHLERWLSSWQKRKIARNPKTGREGSLIEATDRALIFLPEPRGPLVFEEFKERLGA